MRWYAASLLLLVPIVSAAAQSGVQQTGGTPVPTSPPLRTVGLRAEGLGNRKIVRLTRPCIDDTDVQCLPTLNVMLTAEDTAIQHADLIMVHEHDRRRVKMLPQDTHGYHWRVPILAEQFEYPIKWGRLHPRLTDLEAGRFRLVVVGWEDIESPMFQFKPKP